MKENHSLKVFETKIGCLETLSELVFQDKTGGASIAFSATVNLEIK